MTASEESWSSSPMTGIFSTDGAQDLCFRGGRNPAPARGRVYGLSQPPAQGGEGRRNPVRLRKERGTREERRKGQARRKEAVGQQLEAALLAAEFTYREQKEYETIEDEIAALEEKLEALEGEILASATDFVKLNRLTGEKAGTEKLLEEKLDRWMYLEI